MCARACNLDMLCIQGRSILVLHDYILLKSMPFTHLNASSTICTLTDALNSSFRSPQVPFARSSCPEHYRCMATSMCFLPGHHPGQQILVRSDHQIQFFSFFLMPTSIMTVDLTSSLQFCMLDFLLNTIDSDIIVHDHDPLVIEHT